MTACLNPQGSYEADSPLYCSNFRSGALQHILELVNSSSGDIFPAYTGQSVFWKKKSNFFNVRKVCHNFSFQKSILIANINFGIYE